MSTEAKRVITAAVATTRTDPGTLNPGSVVLRAVEVALDSDVGESFIADCARNTEGLMSDLEIKTKWELSDEDWERLATNTPLLHAVRAKREQRILKGECAREAAQRHFAKAPNVLNRILTDEHVSPRHRIEAARELRQVVGNGPDTASGPQESIVISINLGEDYKLVKEFTLPDPARSDEGERL